MAIPTIHMKPSGVKDGTLYSQVPVTKIGDFNVSRGSMATRVNEDGFIETVGYIVGGELVTNGDFATDSDWTKGAGWTIVGGVATSDGTTSNLDQSSVLTTSASYKATVTVSNMTIGALSFRLGSTSGDEAINITSNGTYTFYGVAGGTTLRLRSQSSFDGSVTNISVIEITDDTNLPRINYSGFSFDGSGNIIPNSGCGAWLFEPQSTNLITYSEEFSNPYWNKLRATIVPNSTISPDGSLNASKLVESTDSGTHVLYENNITTGAGTNTLSVKVKPNGRNWVRLYDSEQAEGVFFNLANGTVGSTDGSPDDFSITALTNGWYNITLTTTATLRVDFQIYLAESDGGVPSYTGDGVSGIYVWGAQLEQQSYPTSYIPTSGSTVTRNQDLCTNGGDASLINSTEGVLYVEASFEEDAPSSLARISISNGGAGQRVLLYKSSTSKVIGAIVSNVGSQFNVLYTYTGSADDFFKMAIKWKENDFAFWVNGVEVATDNSGTTPVGLNELQLTGGGGTTDPFYGKTKDLQVYDVALTDLELEVLTSL